MRKLLTASVFALGAGFVASDGILHHKIKTLSSLENQNSELSKAKFGFKMVEAQSSAAPTVAPPTATPSSESGLPTLSPPIPVEKSGELSEGEVSGRSVNRVPVSPQPSQRPQAGENQPSTPQASIMSKLPGYVKAHAKTKDNQQLFQTFYELGIPSDREMHMFSGYLSATDTRLRIPSFVAWTIKGRTSGGSKERKSDRSNSQFHSSPYISEQFNAQNSDYSGEGYDRGHLCPCGDFYYSMGQKALDETFYLSHNVVPQDSNNNRFYWLRLEMFTRGMAKQFDNVHILAGPLFVPEESGNKKFVRYEVIGENNVAVPTHLYRILVGEKKSENKFFIQAFMIPNKPIPKSRPITDFIVPVSDIEKLSGMQLLHKIEKSNTLPLCKHFPCELKAWQELEMQKIIWDKSMDSKEKIEKEWNKLIQEGWKPSPQIVQQYQSRLSDVSK